MTKEDFIKAGFTVIGEEAKENKLLAFLKEHYPSVIKDNEINLQELKAIAGLPIDEKVNGYGLNFVGRNFARAKYAQKTEKELRLNTTLSKNIDTTQNLVLKGDNLDCLKILKNYYSGKIKCIYIDPPYNTDSDEFVYPDKFDKEELEVLGLANLSEDDIARMEFSFKTKKSHNGWLSFMYPRLLLARDLLSKDGVIFISIDDNEQANLKLLCDEIFGEENFVADFIWQKNFAPKNDNKYISISNEYILHYAKNKENYQRNLLDREKKHNKDYKNPDNDPRGLWTSGSLLATTFSQNGVFEIVAPNGKKHIPPEGRCWRFSLEKINQLISENRIWFGSDGNGIPRIKRFLNEMPDGVVPQNWLDYKLVGSGQDGTQELKKIFDNSLVFDFPKPSKLIKHFLKIGSNSNSIVLDFFAGSGTTGHAVMQLNAEDGGNRKFILVQIDEPIKEDKPAYKFCIENNLPPVISSITIERLKRAGEKIKKEIEEENKKGGIFEENKKQVPDIGFKVFDTVDAPKLTIDDNGQIQFPQLNNDSLSRIYNMIFTVGLDDPTQVPEEVVKDCIYKSGDNYYITNSNQISKEDFAKVIEEATKLGSKVFIDGWTASLNATLQHYKEDVKIVF
jgi:adenine-specific DNA-methyltransferase